MSTEYITEPGTEENLRLLMDPHPFDPAQQDMSPPHPALVDGIRALASIGGHGGYSDRIVITLERTTPNSVVSLRPSTTGSRSPVSSPGATTVSPSPSRRSFSSP